MAKVSPSRRSRRSLTAAGSNRAPFASLRTPPRPRLSRPQRSASWTSAFTAIRASRSLHVKTSVRRLLRIGVDEPPDNARLGLAMALELFPQLREGQTRRQRLRLEVGRDDRENIVVRRSRRRTRTAEGRELLAARSSDIFVARLADLARGERSRLGRVRPRQLRGDVLAFAIRSAGGNVAGLLGQHFAVLEGRRRKLKDVRRQPAPATKPERGRRRRQERDPQVHRHLTPPAL